MVHGECTLSKCAIRVDWGRGYTKLHNIIVSLVYTLYDLRTLSVCLREITIVNALMRVQNVYVGAREVD